MMVPVVEVRRYSGDTERHRHDFHQVILPGSGSLDIDIDGRGGRVAGSIGSFVPAGAGHTFRAGKTDAFVVLDVPAAIGPAAMDASALPPFFAIAPEMRGLADYMMAVGAQARLSPSLQGAWSLLLLERLAGRLVQPDRAEQAVSRAVAFMRLRFADPIRMADIARAAALSPTRLHEAFVSRRGMTPHACLVALRLDAAERMLSDPNLSLAEIAIRSGHADQSALTRVMRRERRATPAGLRRLLLEGPGRKA